MDLEKIRKIIKDPKVVDKFVPIYYGKKGQLVTSNGMNEECVNPSQPEMQNVSVESEMEIESTDTPEFG